MVHSSVQRLLRKNIVPVRVEEVEGVEIVEEGRMTRWPQGLGMNKPVEAEEDGVWKGVEERAACWWR